MSTKPQSQPDSSPKVITAGKVSSVLRKAGLPRYLKSGPARSREGFVVSQSLDGLVTVRWELSRSFSSSFAVSPAWSAPTGKAMLESDPGPGFQFDWYGHVQKKIKECQDVLQQAGIETVLKASRLTVILPDAD